MNNPAHTGLVVENHPPQQRSLRVAVVTETYPPEVNGVAHTLQHLVEGLQRRNHQVQLVRPRQTRSEHPPAATHLEQVLVRGLPIPRYPELRMGFPAKSALLALWSRQRPDLVHLATEGPLGWSALQAARKLRLPVCSDFRTNFHAYSQHYGLGWLHKPIAAYLRKFHNQTACTMVPTAALQADLQAMGFERLKVVSRGVDTTRFHPGWRDPGLRAGWGVAPGDVAVLCVGRLAPEKNLGLLLQAYQAMRQVQPRTRLVLVGDGPERAALQAQCPEACFAGARRGEDLSRHYASADVFVFPSLTETYGNVVPEALASGLAVLAYGCAAAAQLIQPGLNGLLAPAGDSNAFCRRAVDLVADPDRTQRLRLAAQASVQAHAWDRIVAQVEGVWLGAMAQGPLVTRLS
jgi:glycosyltransferase involved in cell wall biosynthesis